MTRPDEIAWLNGRLIPFQDAAVPVVDLGVVAGASISEMARTYRHRPFRFHDHCERLLESCAELGFPADITRADLTYATEDVVAHNTRGIAEESDLGIVAFVTAGVNPTYAAHLEDTGPVICVHTFELPFRRWKDAVERGVALTIPERRQLPSDSFPVHRKTRNRLHWWLADRDADRQRPGSRALLLDAHDRITETSSACFFAVINDVVVTPKNGVLRSLSRRLVQATCDGIGVRFRAANLHVSQIGEFREVFLSSTPCGLLPVASIDDQEFAGAAEGTILRQLQQEWTRLTGVDTFHQILTQSTD